jgi:hypothetical protein
MPAYETPIAAIPMPAIFWEKQELFHPQCLRSNGIAFFAFTLCSKTNHGQRSRGVYDDMLQLASKFGFDGLADWQFMSYAG